jgi:hypothetical protein
MWILVIISGLCALGLESRACHPALTQQPHFSTAQFGPSPKVSPSPLNSSPTPVSSVSPQPSISPSSLPTPIPSFTPVSANGLTLTPIENLAEYWGVSLTSEEKNNYGNMYPGRQDTKGNFYFLSLYKVYKFSSVTGKTTFLAGSGQEGDRDGTADQAQLKSFYQCVVMPDQRVYFLDQKYLRKITPQGQIVNINKEVDVRTSLTSLIYDADNQRLIYALQSNGIRELSLISGKFQFIDKEYFSSSQRIQGFVDGDLKGDAKFGSTLIFATGSNSTLFYVYDIDNKAIRLVKDGLVTTLVGGNLHGEYRDGNGSLASFVGFKGQLIYDKDRNRLFLGDDSAIRIIDPIEMRVSTLALPRQNATQNPILGKILRMYMIDKTHWLLHVWPDQKQGSPTYLLKLTLPDGTLPDFMVLPSNDWE